MQEIINILNYFQEGIQRGQGGRSLFILLLGLVSSLSTVEIKQSKLK